MVHLRILGPVEADAGGEPLELGAPRQRALLGILAIHANEVVSLDRLIDLLWDERPPAAAIGSIQAYVSNLRRILEPGRAARQPASVIVTQAPGYVLRVGPDAIDARRFERLAAEGRSLLSSGATRPAVERLDLGLRLWRGEALADLQNHEFARAEATRLDELHLGAHEDRIDALLRLGEHAVTLQASERLVRQHPLRERLRALHLLALYRSGRQVDALRTYDALRVALVEQLGIDPGPEIEALHQQVLHHDPRLGLPSAVRGPASAPHVDPTPGPVGLEADQASSTRLAFVGRSSVLRRLTSRLDGAGRARPQIALVGGEPGIGKTRLAEEMADQALERGALVAWGRSHEEGMPPLWPWTAVVRSLLGAEEQSLPDLLGIEESSTGPAESELTRFRIYDRVREVVEQRAGEQPVVIVLDDLQWADTTSLRLLRFIASELSAPGVFIIGLFHEPGPSDEALGAALADLVRRPGVDRLGLVGLGPAEVSELVRLETAVGPDDLGAASSALHRRTGGNPFFVTELVRLLASERGLDPAGRLQPVEEDSVPLVVGDVIRRRLRRLPEDLRVVLGVASVIGRSVELEVLDQVVGLGEDETYELLEVAVMARLVTEPRPGSFEFSHGLVRDTLYSDLGLGRRARLHGRVADAIEVVHAADLQPHVEQLAHHASAAGDLERTAHYAHLAAQEAERTSSFDEAVRWWQQALDAVDASSPRPPTADAVAERARLLLRLAAAHRGGGDATACAAALDQALDAAEASGDLALLGEAALDYGEVVLWQAPPYGTVDDRVVQAIERALDAAPEDDPRSRARLLTALAVAIYYDEAARERSRRLAREAVATARAADDDPQVLAHALVELIMMLDSEPDLAEERAAAEELRSVIDRAPAIGVEVAAPARMRLTRLRFMSGEGADLEREVAQATQQAIDARHEVIRLWATWAETGVAVLRGRLADAEALAGTAFELHHRLGLWGAEETYALHMVQVWREQDRLADIGPLVRAPMEASDHPGARKLWGIFLLDAGDLDGVSALLGDEPVPRPRDWTWLAEVCVTAELAAAVGAPCCAELYATLSQLDPRIVVMDGTWACFGATSHYLGLLAAALGRCDEAVAHLEEAVRLHDRAGAVLWSTRSRLHLAGALAHAAEPRVGDVLAAAVEQAAGHGLVRLERDLRELVSAQLRTPRV